MLLQTPAATRRRSVAPLLLYNRRRIEWRMCTGNGRVAAEPSSGVGVALKAAPSCSPRRGEQDGGPEGPDTAPSRAALVNERDRLAAELYDTVIHRLFAAGLSLHSAAARLLASGKSRSTAVTAGHVDDAIRILDDAIGEIRTTLYRAPDRGHGGRMNLLCRLQAVVTDMTAVLGFAPSVRMAAALADAVPDGIADDLVVALRELLANIVRHARARTVAVTLSIESGRLILQVVDDGVGIGAGTQQGGLADLQNRAEHHGGSLRTSETDRPGTQILWSVPI